MEFGNVWKTRVPIEKPLRGNREPTTNLSHIHIGGKRVL